jgi:hypothetical protein
MPGRAWVAVAAFAAVAAAIVAVVLAGREPGPAPTPRDSNDRAAGTVAAAPDPADRRPVHPAPSPPGPVRGVVVDVAGAPVAGAEVFGVHAPSGTSIEARTAGDGAFTLVGLPPEPVRVLVHHRDFLRQNVEVPVAGRDGLRLVAHRRPVLRGRVLDASLRLPIARFCVSVMPLEGDELPGSPALPPGVAWQHAPDGAFEVVTPAAGPHTLLVFTEHHCTVRERVQLDPDAVVERDVRAEAGVCVRGRVLDAAGNAVPEAAVTLHPVEVAAGELATTGHDGTFALRPVAPGAYVVIVQPRDRPSLRRTDLRLQASAPDPFLDLVLPPGAAVFGTVQPWQAGRSAEVVLVHDDGPVRRAPVDAATGAFELDELTPGWHAVSVERTEASWRSSVARQLFEPRTALRVELTPGARQRVEPVDVVATMARLRGVVAGHAAPDRLAVRAFREDAELPERAAGLFRAVPGADGRFELDGVLPGRWRLQVMAGDDVLHWEVHEVAASKDVELVLRVPAGR